MPEIDFKGDLANTTNTKLKCGEQVDTQSDRDDGVASSIWRLTVSIAAHKFAES